MGHPARMRVSDAERNAVVARLGQATSEGRLTLDEFDARSRYAYASRTRYELYSVVDDLPSAPGTGSTAPAPTPAAAALALVFGVLSLPLAGCLPLGIISAVIGVLLAIIALGSGDLRSPRHRTMAVVGLVCGVIGIVLPIAGLVIFNVSIS